MLAKINGKIRKEWQCIFDLSEKILNLSDREKVKQYKRDVKNSMREIERLERKKMYLTAAKLAHQGINTKVVKRHAN